MTRVDGRITVFLADDNVTVREGVRALLGLEQDLDVVGTAEDYDRRETTLAALTTRPDAVDLGAVVVKGRSAPVHAFCVVVEDSEIGGT
jgi:DNA-binding NarL/FixJ family response regulator